MPATYAEREPQSTFPVLWITDNNLEAAAIHLEGLDLILVSVGAEPTISAAERQARRTFDFTPDRSDLYWRGPSGDYLRQRFQSANRRQPDATGGASRFLNFLLDDVRPVLAAEYPMDENDHGLIGHSGGGLFVAYSLFGRPGGFTRYICGSPMLKSGNCAVFTLEEEYAATHEDLAAHVFFGAGEAEITEDLVGAMACVSSMVEMAERLSFRHYPSLQLAVKIFPGESHATVFTSILSWGVRSVWGQTLFAQT